jgi:hypothetical protein
MNLQNSKLQMATVPVFAVLAFSMPMQQANLVQFEANTPAKASEVNQNFAAINTELGTLDTSINGINAQIADLTGANIQDGSIATADLANDAVTIAKLAPDSVDSSKIVDSTVTGSDIVDGSLTHLDVSTTGSNGPTHTVTSPFTAALFLDRTVDTQAASILLFQRVPTIGAGFFIESRVSTDPKFKVNENGDATADGTFTGGGADFAEMIRVTSGASTVEAGDVVVLDPAEPRSVLISMEANSRLVAGVYSTKPAFLGSEREWDEPDPQLAGQAFESGRIHLTRSTMADKYDEVPIAIVGIVPCKVTDEGGPIRIGDLLVTSSTSGHAMRRNDPEPGTMIGKAMEPLTAREGVIRVLMALQ